MNEKNRFPHAVAFRLDTPTFEALRTAAEAAGMSPGAWVRALLLKALGSAMKAPKVRRAAANAVLLDAILDELKAQGRNINQIAKTANTTGSAAQIAADVPVMRSALEALVARILDLLRIEDDA
jgi:23S rRNA maturation mini-RNase III